MRRQRSASSWPRFPDRPIVAHIAIHNIGSQRVVEHCGFVRVGEAAADDGVREVIYRLD